MQYFFDIIYYDFRFCLNFTKMYIYHVGINPVSCIYHVDEGHTFWKQSLMSLFTFTHLWYSCCWVHNQFTSTRQNKALKTFQVSIGSWYTFINNAYISNSATDDQLHEIWPQLGYMNKVLTLTFPLTITLTVTHTWCIVLTFTGTHTSNLRIDIKWILYLKKSFVS